jgi:hypothetical protein
VKGQGSCEGTGQLLGGGTPFPSTTALSIDNNRFCARSKKSQALRMTALSGGLEIQLVGYAENTKRSKKSRALRMTFLWGF